MTTCSSRLGGSEDPSLSSEDRLYGILPLSHIVGLSIVFLGTLLSGAQSILSLDSIPWLPV